MNEKQKAINPLPSVEQFVIPIPLLIGEWPGGGYVLHLPHYGLKLPTAKEFVGAYYFKTLDEAKKGLEHAVLLFSV